MMQQANTYKNYSAQDEYSPTGTTIFVGGLAFNIQENDIFNYFSKYGPINKINLLRNSQTGLSKGFAFVFFVHPNSTDKVLKLSDHYILGRKIDCQLAQEKHQKKEYALNSEGKRLYVGKLYH
jgi:RNA recognition motif-containing protein